MRLLICVMVFAVRAGALSDIGVDLHRVRSAPPAYAITQAPRPAQRVSDAGPLLGFVGVLALNVADIETAQYDLHHCQCREANPLARSRPLAYGVGLPFDVIGFVWARRSHRDHPRDRSWMIPTIAGVSVHSFGLAMNERAR